MSQLEPGCAPSMTPAPTPSLARGTRGLIRWVCTNNPFYVLSALLVLVGLWVSFGAQVRAEQTWALMSGMAGYTLLLAIPACLLVRFGGVWEDVRTVLLLVVLMFLATSVTFDETLARSPGLGIKCYLGGFVFAVTVSEGMLRAMRLSLLGWFRLPYYLFLAMFFLYPLALVPLLDQPRSVGLQWALFGFSPAAGLVALTLFPAIRRGAAYVRSNGSPWRWPLYPWALFVFLGFGVAARSFLLCWSMQHIERSDPEQLIFGPYFLVPFLLAVTVLLLEIGRVARSEGTLRVAMILPAGLACLAMVGDRPDELYQGFFSLFSTQLGGTPLYLTLLALVGFYAYAMLRRVPLAFGALTMTLAVLCVVGPDSRNLNELTMPRPWPLLVIGVMQLGVGLRGRNSFHCAVGAGCLILATSRGAVSLGWVEAFHLALLAGVILGAAFDDALARILRSVCALLALLACLVLLSGNMAPPSSVPRWVVSAYAPTIAALLLAYGQWLRHQLSRIVAALIVIGWLAAHGWRTYGSLRGIIGGLDFIVVGLLLLLLAHTISLGKAGLLHGRLLSGKAKAPPSLD